MAVCKGDGIPSEGKSMHKGRGGGQISNFEGWDERVPADIWGLENTGKRWERERESERKTTLKFAAAVTGRLMMPLLDTGMSGRRASFAGMINSSGRDTVRQQEELPDPEGCETMRKIVKSPGNLPQRGGEGLSSLWPTLWPELERLLVTLPGRGTGVTLQISTAYLQMAILLHLYPSLGKQRGLQTKMASQIVIGKALRSISPPWKDALIAWSFIHGTVLFLPQAGPMSEAHSTKGQFGRNPDHHVYFVCGHIKPGNVHTNGLDIPRFSHIPHHYTGAAASH